MRIAACLRAGDVLAIEGPMGAGKTTLVGLIAKALGSTDPVSSPTFAIAQCYEGRLPVWHLDLYRVEEQDLYDIGYEDYFYPEDAVTMIEWPEKAGGLLPEDVMHLQITVEGGRKLVIDTRLLEREAAE